MGTRITDTWGQYSIYMPKLISCIFYPLNFLHCILLNNIQSTHAFSPSKNTFFCLFVLRFYSPVNPMGPCRAWSVYLTTRLLGRLSPLSGYVLCTFFRQKLDNCPSWISGRERMTIENISWSISTKECCRPQLGLNPRPPGLQSDGASNWATEAGYVRPVCNTNGFRAISFENIGVLDWNFIHKYIIIKCRSSSI